MERALDRTQQSTAPQAQEAATRLTANSVQQRDDVDAASALRDDLCRRLEPAVQTVQKTLLGGGTPGHPRQLSSWQLDVNGFLDALLPPTGSEPDPTRPARDAIRALAQHDDGLARTHLTTWSTRLGSPKALKEWMKRQEQVTFALLNWRPAQHGHPQWHVHCHRGRADRARRRTVVDMVLEIIGNWQAGEHASGSPESDALAVIQKLAAREQGLVNSLRDAASCRPLNVATITGPGSDAWNRP